MASYHLVALPLGGALQEIGAPQDRVAPVFLRQGQHRLLPLLLLFHRVPVGEEVIALVLLAHDAGEVDGEPPDRYLPPGDGIEQRQHRRRHQGAHRRGAGQVGLPVVGGQDRLAVADADGDGFGDDPALHQLMAAVQHHLSHDHAGLGKAVVPGQDLGKGDGAALGGVVLDVLHAAALPPPGVVDEQLGVDAELLV